MLHFLVFSLLWLPSCNWVLLIRMDFCFIAALVWLNIHHKWLYNFLHEIRIPSAYHCFVNIVSMTLCNNVEIDFIAQNYCLCFNKYLYNNRSFVTGCFRSSCHYIFGPWVMFSLFSSWIKCYVSVWIWEPSWTQLLVWIRLGKRRNLY